jgi:hypothetical protein
MPSHPVDGAAESYWRWRCRGDVGHGAMSLPSYASDDTADPRWRWRCRDDLATMQCHCRVMMATALPSHTGDDAVKVTGPRGDVDAESCWQRHY